MPDSPRFYRIQVRLNEDQYFEATNEAAQAGVSKSTHLRNVFANRHDSKAGGGLGYLSPNRDFAEQLATAIAVMTIVGSHQAQGLEAQVEALTREVLTALGAT